MNLYNIWVSLSEMHDKIYRLFSWYSNFFEMYLQCHRLIASMPHLTDAVICAKIATTKHWVYTLTYFKKLELFCFASPFLFIDLRIYLQLRYWTFDFHELKALIKNENKQKPLLYMLWIWKFHFLKGDKTIAFFPAGNINQSVFKWCKVRPSSRLFNNKFSHVDVPISHILIWQLGFKLKLYPLNTHRKYIYISPHLCSKLLLEINVCSSSMKKNTASVFYWH